MNQPKFVDQALNASAELVEKGITTANLASETIGAGLIAPQNLSPLLPNLAQRKTSFYDRVNKPQGLGTAAEFNMVSALFASGESANPVEAFYDDVNGPAEKSSAYASRLNPYKSAGFKGSVSGRAMRRAKGGTPTDLEAQEVQNTMQRVRQALDWLAFWSRSDVTNSNGIAGYQGLDQLITTNVIDAAGAPLTGDAGKALIDKAAKKISYHGGAGEVSHMFSSIGVGIDVDNTYNTKEQININMGEDTAKLRWGNRVTSVLTVAGELELVPTYSINPGTPYNQGQPYSASSGPEGTQVSTVFLLAMKWINYEELLPMSKLDLALLGDSHQFLVIEDGTVTLHAEPWCAKIINVRETSYEA
jgi:hypothetical protein